MRYGMVAMTAALAVAVSSAWALGPAAVQVGGSSNSSEGNGASQVGGYNNNAFGGAAVVTGGVGNSADLYGTVAGGGSNTGDPAGAVGGGIGNNAGLFGTIGGGGGNTAGPAGIVAGGAYNVSGLYGSIGGGAANNTAPAAFVGGGAFNNAALYGTIGGGSGNSAGAAGFVGGGTFNNASGAYSAILGGTNNTSAGNLSTVIGGRGGNAATVGSMVLVDGSEAVSQTNLPNQLLIRFENGIVTSGTLSPAGMPVVSLPDQAVPATPITLFVPAGSNAYELVRTSPTAPAAGSGGTVTINDLRFVQNDGTVFVPPAGTLINLVIRRNVPSPAPAANQTITFATTGGLAVETGGGGNVAQPNTRGNVAQFISLGPAAAGAPATTKVWAQTTHGVVDNF